MVTRGFDSYGANHAANIREHSQSTRGKTMKLIAERDCVGDGRGWAVFRNLYEKEDGSRVSVVTSRIFWIKDVRPRRSDDELWELYKLDNVQLPLTTHKG